MAIDASIISGLRAPQFTSPQDLYAQKAAFDQNELANRLGGLKLEEAQRGVTENNALNEAYRGALKPDGTVDRNILYSRVAGSGLGAKLPTIQKGFADADKASVDSEQAKFKLANERYGVYQSAIGALANDPGLTREKVLQTGQALVDQGILTAEMMAKATGNLSDDPMQLRQTLTAGLKSQLKPDQIFTIFAPKAEKIDNGASITFKDTNPNSPTFGQNIAGAPIAKEQSPDSRASVAQSERSSLRSDARARDANNIASAGNVIKTETDLRKEFADLPEVKRYKAAYPSFKAIEDAAKSNNPQADINLIYGLAKLYDPESVVREGEYATIANSQAIPERIKSIAQSLIGNGKLTPETKRQIIEQARNRMAAFEGEYGKAQEAYSGIAKGRGARTENIIPKVGEPVQRDNGPKAGTVQDGFRFKGGDPANKNSWEKV